jgi:hypothetical protein
MISITIAMVMAVSNQLMCGALTDCRNSDSSMVSNLVKILIFKIAVLFIRLGSLMICTHDLAIVKKTKENNPLLRIVCVQWENRSQHTFLSF